MKYTIERAGVVREIQAVEGSKLIIKKVLPLMGVEFVRYGMLTVVPFPFKYLREYILKKEKSVYTGIRTNTVGNTGIYACGVSSFV